MKRILIAEDDKFLANAYRVKLVKAGFDVMIASDGQEAVKAMDSYAPDLVIMDLMMPVKDGFTALREIRSNTNWKDLPVIVASNLGQKEDYDRATDLGATEFIVKSDLSLEDLVGKIKVLLNEPLNPPEQPLEPSV